MPTASRDMPIINTLGLHARPAMQFVDLANQFKSDIRVRTVVEQPVEADGKSIMEMMMLEAIPGTLLRVTASGDDAEQALEKLAELVSNKFYED